MGLTGLFEIQGMLFNIMILDLLLKKRDVIKEQNQELLTDLVVYVTLPCSIVHSFKIKLDHEILVNCLIILVVALGIQVGSYILNFILYPHMDERRKKVLRYATICSSAGVLSNPIAESIFGPLGLLYAPIYLIPQRVFMWSAGLTYFTETSDKKTLVKEVATYSYIPAVGLGLILMISDIGLPSVAEQTVETLALVSTALPMLSIGGILAGVSFKSLWNRVTLYCSPIRLAFVPCLIYLFCLAFHMEPVVTRVSVVLVRILTASVTAVLAVKYKCDTVFAARCVVSSTLLPMVTVPALYLMVR